MQIYSEFSLFQSNSAILSRSIQQPTQLYLVGLNPRNVFSGLNCMSSDIRGFRLQ